MLKSRGSFLLTKMICLNLKENDQRTYRSITIDGDEIEFSGGFTDLHTIVYKDILNGGGFGLEAARPSIDICHQIRNAQVIGINDNSHPILK